MVSMIFVVTVLGISIAAVWAMYKDRQELNRYLEDRMFLKTRNKELEEELNYYKMMEYDELGNKYSVNFYHGSVRTQLLVSSDLTLREYTELLEFTVSKRGDIIRVIDDRNEYATIIPKSELKYVYVEKVEKNEGVEDGSAEV